MFHPKFRHKLALHHCAIRRAIRHCAIATLLGLSISQLGGCTAKKFNPEMTLTVMPEGQPGLYTLKGQTNLPQPDVEKRKQPIVINIQAIRLLIPKANAKTLTNRKPLHAVIARQRIESLDGKWEAKLNLLKPNPKGGAVEIWQLHAGDIPADLEPAPEVTFLAATDSIDRTLDFSPDANKPTTDGRKPVLQSATDGNLFLQAESVQPIAPPALPKMAATAPKAITKVIPQPLSEKSSTKQNDAPVLSREILR